MTETFAIIQVDQTPLPRDTLADIMVGQLNMVRFDALRAATEAKWILFENLSDTEAKKINIALNAAKIPNRLVPASRMVNAAKPTPTLNADCHEMFLVQEGYSQNMIPISWDEILLVSAGAFTEIHRRNEIQYGSIAKNLMNASGEGGKVHQKVFKSVERSKTRIAVEVVSAGKTTGYHRIFHDSFNYDYLGPRLQLNKSANFKLFVEDLVMRAEKALITPETEALLNSARQSEYTFKDSDEFIKYNRWNLQLLVEKQADLRARKAKGDENDSYVVF